MKIRKAVLGAVAVLALGASAVVATTSSWADEAEPQDVTISAPACNTAVKLKHNGATYHRPAYVGSGGMTDVGCVMGVGSAHKGVESLQITLSACYGQKIKVDGIFGSGTAQALKNAQAFHGITADGVYGPNTAKALAFDSTPNGAFFKHC